MIDIKIIHVKDILRLSQVDYVRKAGLPASLDIVGENLNRATEIFVNDIPVTEFVILSSTRIIAQIPSGQTRSKITAVLVLSTVPLPGDRSLLHFEVGRSFESIQGVERMVQTFAKIAIQTPGSDRFRPDLGGGLKQLIGRNVEKGGGRAVQSSVAGAINRTRDQLITLQNRNPRIPVDERLRSATTLAAGFNPTTTTLAVRVLLQAVSGRQAVANLTL
jgi:phage baseplate assembly protein W